MAVDSGQYRTQLKRVKGLGSSHHGLSHWWLQRVTAVALVPLSVWFIISLMSSLLTTSVVKVAEWFASPFNSVLMILLLGSTFVHAKLGIQVVIEDYVKCSKSKFLLLFLNMFVCSMLAAISILAVLKLHFLDIASTI